jgi:hypothetical protein
MALVIKRERTGTSGRAVVFALPDGRTETCVINYLFHQVGHVTEHKLLGHNISLRL